MKRRRFVTHAAGSVCALSMAAIFSQCKSDKKIKQVSRIENTTKTLKISLAEWSLHRSIADKSVDANEFAAIARNRYGIDAVEYVNGFYLKQAENESFWQEMKTRADDVAVKSLLIMVDEEGDLGSFDEIARTKAIMNHYKWIHAAKIMGCHSVRVNAFGDEEKYKYKTAIVDSMGRLAEYAGKEGLNIIIENHGLYSSDAALIAEIIREVNMSNMGSFPDFGNWCLSAKWGTTQHECDQVYDRYQGVAELLPYAKAVSAKSYNFNAAGDDSKIDYYKMLDLVKQSTYDGYIGIEYEGEKLSEHEGILATKALLEKAWSTYSS